MIPDVICWAWGLELRTHLDLNKPAYWWYAGEDSGDADLLANVIEHMPRALALGFLIDQLEAVGSIHSGAKDSVPENCPAESPQPP